MAGTKISDMSDPTLPLDGGESLPVHTPSGASGKTYKVSPKQLVEELTPVGRPKAGPTLSGGELLSVAQSETIYAPKNDKVRKVTSSSLKGGERINVREFDVLGDAIAECNEARNKAHIINEIIRIAISKSKGGAVATVYFPPGVYYIYGPLVISQPNVRLQGAGRTRTKIRFNINKTLILEKKCEDRVNPNKDLIRFLPTPAGTTATHNSNCGIFGMTVEGNQNTRYGLYLQNQKGFLAEDIKVAGGEVGLFVDRCLDLQMSNVLAQVALGDGGMHPRARPRASIVVSGGTRRFFIDKSYIDGLGDGIQVDRSSVHLNRVCLESNDGRAVHLLGAQDCEVHLSQGHFEGNKQEYIYQPDIADTSQHPALVRLVDCAVAGPGDDALLTDPLDHRIRVSHCNLVIRNSPGTGGKNIKDFLSLPARTKDNLGKVNAHLDCVHFHLDGLTADDPSGIMTGNVSRFVKRQTSRATRVEGYPAPSGSGNPSLAYELDLELGGVKELSVSGKVDVKLKGTDPAVNGTELQLVLFNDSATQASVTFHPVFLLQQGQTGPLTLGGGEVRVMRFIFQPQQQLWTLIAHSPHFPSGGQPVFGERGGEGMLMEAQEVPRSKDPEGAGRTIWAHVVQGAQQPVQVGEMVHTNEGFRGTVIAVGGCCVQI